MASYALNEAAVAHAEDLIRKRQYVLSSEWNQVQPRAEAQNAYLKNHSWEQYAQWPLGVTEGATDETKSRYAFVYGDFRRVHRMGLIASVYRASEGHHKAIAVAAPDLLQPLDSVRGGPRSPRQQRAQLGVEQRVGQGGVHVGGPAQ